MKNISKVCYAYMKLYALHLRKGSFVQVGLAGIIDISYTLTLPLFSTAGSTWAAPSSRYSSSALVYQRLIDFNNHGFYWTQSMESHGVLLDLL